MNKPIEPGCLALMAPAKTHFGNVIKGTNPYRDRPAQAVTVRCKDERAGHIPCQYCGKKHNDWLVDGAAFHNGFAIVCACLLTRIDGHDPDAEITEQEKELSNA